LLPDTPRLRHDERREFERRAVMDAETVIALTSANGVKIAREEAEKIAGVLKPTLARLSKAAAATPFDDEPAALLKVLRP
jgi:hypothetical protein